MNLKQLCPQLRMSYVNINDNSPLSGSFQGITFS